MRLARTEIELCRSNTGEVECIKWRDVIFHWSSNYNDIDEYVAKGPFLGIHPKKVFEELTIKADWDNNLFFLKTGQGKEFIFIDLLGFKSKS